MIEKEHRGLSFWCRTVFCYQICTGIWGKKSELSGPSTWHLDVHCRSTEEKIQLWGIVGDFALFYGFEYSLSSGHPQKELNFHWEKVESDPPIDSEQFYPLDECKCRGVLGHQSEEPSRHKGNQDLLRRCSCREELRISFHRRWSR